GQVPRQPHRKHDKRSLGILLRTTRSQQRKIRRTRLLQQTTSRKSVLYTKYVDILSSLTLDSFEPGVPSQLRSIPHEIAHLIKERDEPTLSLQVDSQMVRTEVHGTLEKEGIIFSSIHSALANNPDLARSHFTKAIPPDDDKFAALNNAFFTAGTFLYVPKGLNIKIPFRKIVLLKTRHRAAFTHNIILYQENSKE